MKAIFLLLIAFLFLSTSTRAQTTEFTYQGRLLFSGVPANGSFDFEFRLFDDVSIGSQLGATDSLTAVNVSNGVFSVRLDFGNQFPGAARFLEIRVRQVGDESFTVLAPRQSITSAPYAIRSLSAAAADNTTQLGGVTADQFVQTSDTRMSDARNPLAGSANYIQNSINLQPNSNFNIAGNGVATGTLSANTVNAAGQFNLNGQSILSASLNQENISLGFSAGPVSAGSRNSFFGQAAGARNSGEWNSFFGAGTGGSNTTGTNNSFFGERAGSRNMDASSNSFFGSAAGGFNLSGAQNSFFGAFAGFQNSTGANNAFFGANTGQSNTTAANNSFFGTNAGRDNTTGEFNSFFGSGAGESNKVDSNSFFGAQTGSATTTGGFNSFFGAFGGQSNTTGGGNSFFGFTAGKGNTVGNENAFFGESAGFRNTSGNENTFFGNSTGVSNTTGNNNSAFGAEAGSSNATGSFNSYLGGIADSADGLTNATAVGTRAYVAQSNSLVLGSISGLNGANATVNVGIGTIAPQQRLHVDGTEVLSTGFQSGFKFRNRGSTSANDDWVWYSAGNVARFFRAGVGDLLTIQTNGVVTLTGFGSAGSTALCRNASNQISACSSSLRYKANIKPFSSGLDLIKRLRPVSFRWKDGGMLDLGLVAEEVNKVEPLLTTSNDRGEIEGVKYDRLGIVLVNSIKEQQDQIETQQKQIEQQQQELESLKSIVCAKKQTTVCRPKH